jgi:HAD superfamily phosphatase (TIGR01668 family)
MTFYQKCIPHSYRASIFDIDYKELKKQGIVALFFDLDNTIIGYDEAKLHENQVAFINQLKKDFKVIVLSNTNNKRVSLALSDLDVPFIWYATKPLKRGFRKALKMMNVKKEEAIMIGDQLMTDVFGANRIGIKTILVKSVKRKSDRKITRFNRIIESFVLKKIQKKYPNLYEERLKQYVIDHTM